MVEGLFELFLHFFIESIALKSLANPIHKTKHGCYVASFASGGNFLFDEMRNFSIGGLMSKEEFLRHLKAYRRFLPRQVILTLRGQALSGDIDGAIRGLAHVLKNISQCVPPCG